VKFYTWLIALCGAETCILQEVDEKYLESFEMSCCRRMEKISLTNHVRSENVLQKVKVDRKFLQTIKIWKTN
jgi:hypothetical protein